MCFFMMTKKFHIPIENTNMIYGFYGRGKLKKKITRNH